MASTLDPIRRPSRVRRSIGAGALGAAISLGFALAGCGADTADAAPTAADAADAGPRAEADLPRIAVVLSYHDAYPWQAGLLEGLRATIADQARLDLIRLDVKRHPEDEWVQRVSDDAAARIRAFDPAAVITCDDVATREMHARLAGDGIPIVFCGVNWPADTYPLPHPREGTGTGMVELSPTDQVLALARSVSPRAERLLYIAGDRMTDRINMTGYEELAAEHGFTVEPRFVTDLDGWKAAVSELGDLDVAVVANNAGIPDWDDAKAARHLRQHGRGATFSHFGWMAPVSCATITKDPTEQTAWAAATALHIAGGADCSGVPIVPNLRFGLVANRGLSDALGVSLPRGVLSRASEVIE